MKAKSFVNNISFEQIFIKCKHVIKLWITGKSFRTIAMKHRQKIKQQTN